MSKALTITQHMAAFRTAFNAGIEGIVKASEIYVEAIDQDPRNADKFREAFAEWVPSSAWSQFEAVGRKWMHPRLIMGGVSDRKKSSAIKRLPYSTQERVFNRERFDLLTADGDTLKVDLLEATADQTRQLCNGSTIRTLSEQRAWLESRATESVTTEAEVLPYVVTGGKVTFRRAVTLSRSELKRLLTEM